MADTWALLVEEVLPAVPIRQWVLSVPFPLRILFAREPEAMGSVLRLLEVARPLGVPVAKCYTAYESKRDIPYWKVEVLYKDFFYRHPSTELDERIHDPDHDFTFCKTAPSIFFETPLKTFLIKHQVDAVIITECTTSGCIRASIIDAFSNGYRVIVPEDCCGDMAEGSHHENRGMWGGGMQMWSPLKKLSLI